MPVNHDQLTLTSSGSALTTPRAVASTRRLRPAALAERLGIEQAADELVHLGGPAGAHPGAGCSPLCTAFLRAATASTVSTCDARAPPPASSIIASCPVDRCDVRARLHLRSHPPARPGLRAGPHSRVADGRRPGDTPVTIDADSR